MKRITAFLIFSVAITLVGCVPIFQGPCSFRVYELPIKVYPFQDTFHIRDTLHIKIDFPVEYEYDGEVYTVTENIEIESNLALPTDSHVNDGSALHNFKLIIDTTKYNLIEYQYQINGLYALLGEIEKVNDRLQLFYKLVPQDIGIISMRFNYNAHGQVPDVEFEGNCYPTGEIFNLDVPSNKDDNWDIFQKHWAWFIEEQPNFTYEQDYKEHAAFTFYVVE